MFKDFRKLNAVIVKDSYSLPRVDSIADNLNGAAYFITLDLFLRYIRSRWRSNLKKQEVKLQWTPQFKSQRVEFQPNQELLHHYQNSKKSVQFINLFSQCNRF